MRVFRIAAAQFARSRKEAFSGQGGLQASARWHTAGQAVVYAAQSLSLAALEILVHLKQTTDLQPFRFFVVEIPDEFILMPASFRTTNPEPPLAPPAIITNFSPRDLTKPLIAGLGPTNVASMASPNIASIAVGPALNETHLTGTPIFRSNSPSARA